MNPSRITTNLCATIDTWHFWTYITGQEAVAFDIEMQRVRDIEQADKVTFVAVQHRKCEPGTKMRKAHDALSANGFPSVLRAESMIELRDLIVATLRSCEKQVWRTVIVTAMRGQSAERTDKDYINGMLLSSTEQMTRLAFTWRVAEQTTDGKFYRRNECDEPDTSHRSRDMGRYVFTNPRELFNLSCSDGEMQVNVHPYTEELELALSALDGKVNWIAERLVQLVDPKTIDKLPALLKGNLLEGPKE